MLIKERPWYLESIKKQSSVDHWLSAYLIRPVIARQVCCWRFLRERKDTQASRKGLALSFFCGRLLKLADRTDLPH